MRTAVVASAAIALFTARAATAGGIDYISSRSPDFVRLMSRNASTDAPDIVSYNPAGLTSLPPGLHLGAGNQFLFKTYTVEAAPPGASVPETYEASTPTLLLPDIYAVYRTGSIAAFAALTAPAGGGALEFAEGLTVLPLFETGLQQAVHANPYVFASMSDGSLEASSTYLGFTAGGAWEFADGFSASAGARFVSAGRSYDAVGDFVIIDASLPVPAPIDTTHHELHAEKSASGLAGIAGLCWSPSEKVTAALRFETATSLEFETDLERNDWAGLPGLESFEDGAVQRRDLPAVVAGGVEAALDEDWSMSVSLCCYLTEQADQGDGDGLDDRYENGFDVGTGIQFCPSDRLALSAGYLFSDLGGSDSTYTDLEYSLDAHFAGTGARWTMPCGTDLTLALARLVCVEGEGTGAYEGSIYDKSVWYAAVGLTRAL